MSAKNSGRTWVLAAIVGVLAVLVVVDQITKARDADADTTSARARYLDRAKVVQAKRDLVARASDWTAAVETARSAWAETQPMLVQARTPDLAVAGFRDDVLAATSDFDLPTKRIAASKTEPIAGAPGLHLLELRLEVQSHDVPDIIRLIDKLENLPHRLAGVAEVRLDGPGQNTAGRDLGATVVVQSIGYVEAGGAP